MGAIAMRLESSTRPTRRGVKSFVILVLGSWLIFDTYIVNGGRLFDWFFRIEYIWSGWT